MPDKDDNNILKYNPGEKCMKVPFVTCAELECLLECLLLAFAIMILINRQ